MQFAKVRKQELELDIICFWLDWKGGILQMILTFILFPERTNYLHLNKIQDRWWWYATTMCSLPTVFLQPHCLSRSQINSSRNKKNPRNWKDSVSVRVLDNHHIKFFMDVYKEKHLLLRKNMCCANPSRLKKCHLWLIQFVTKMICQKTKNTSK